MFSERCCCELSSQVRGAQELSLLLQPPLSWDDSALVTYKSQFGRPPHIPAARVFLVWTRPSLATVKGARAIFFGGPFTRSLTWKRREPLLYLTTKHWFWAKSQESAKPNLNRATHTRYRHPKSQISRQRNVFFKKVEFGLLRSPVVEKKLPLNRYYIIIDSYIYIQAGSR